MNIIYRSIEKSEIKDLAILNDYLFNLSKSEFDETLNEKWAKSGDYEKHFRKYLDENKFLLIAFDNTKMIGYVGGGIEESPKYRHQMKIAMLENLMVLPEYQGNGIGSKLTKKFLDWAKTNKVSRCQVSVYSKNHLAIEFYKEFGFEEYDLNLEIEL